MKILVIETLGLHLGYLGCYGNTWVATPNLDRLATEGIVFDNHIVDQPESRAETAWESRSVGTGRFALPGMEARPSAAAKPRVARVDSLTSFAANALHCLEDHDAWLWLEGPSLLPPWALEDELLEAYFDDDDIEEGLAPWPDPPLELVTLEEAEVLQLQNTYAAVVTVFDAQLGTLLDRLREEKKIDEYLICVTARSGLPLGEHGMIGAPRPGLYDELVHVPLLMRRPHAADAGLRIGALTQPIDLLPTFLESLGHPVPPMHGRSVWPLIRDEVHEVRPHAMSAMRAAGYEFWLLRTLDAALHLPILEPDDKARSPQLFLKPEDRWEVNDLYQQQIERAETMEKALREFVATIQA